MCYDRGCGVIGSIDSLYYLLFLFFIEFTSKYLVLFEDYLMISLM